MKQPKANTPVLSAIVISRNDEGTIERTMQSIVTQEVDVAIEFILVSSGTDRTAEIVKSKFPNVRIIELEKPALPGKARNAGILAARGEFISFPGSHVELPPGSLTARIQAHRRGFPMVTGSILNGTLTRSGWASYFLDHSNALPGRPSGQLSAPPMHCSYKRNIVIRAGLFPEDMRAGEDTVLNTRLWKQGYRAYRDNRVTLIHRSRCRNPWLLAQHHFIRGRAWGRIISERGYTPAELLGYLPQRLKYTGRNVAQWGGPLNREYHRARFLCIVGATAAWLGTCYQCMAQWMDEIGIKANVSRHSES